MTCKSLGHSQTVRPWSTRTCPDQVKALREEGVASLSGTGGLDDRGWKPPESSNSSETSEGVRLRSLPQAGRTESPHRRAPMLAQSACPRRLERRCASCPSD